MGLSLSNSFDCEVSPKSNIQNFSNKGKHCNSRGSSSSFEKFGDKIIFGRSKTEFTIPCSQTSISSNGNRKSSSSYTFQRQSSSSFPNQKATVHEQFGLNPELYKLEIRQCSGIGKVCNKT